MVGIPVLAQKLIQIQANLIVKCLPDIIRKVDVRLSSNIEELNKLPRAMTSIAEAMAVFVQIIGNTKESLKKILLRGEFDEYPDEKDMHCTARLAEMHNMFSEEIQDKGSKNKSNDKFLLDVISILEESKAIGLPNFLPRTAFMTLLQMKIKEVGLIPIEFADKIWAYIEKVVLSVITKHSDNFPKLQSSTMRAAQNLLAVKRKQSQDWVLGMVEMEKMTDYTCNQEYVDSWNNLMAYQGTLMCYIRDSYNKVKIEGYGEVEISHLRGREGVVREAFDMKMRLTAYWKIVVRRMVDSMALHLMFNIQKLVNGEMEAEIVKGVISLDGKGLEMMLEESAVVAKKRNRLNNSIKVLKESKDVMAKII